MARYRVTYVDSVLREVILDAANAVEAEDLARKQLEEAQHHHAVDAWIDDWQAEPYRHQPVVNRHCFECGEERS
jgi:predicted secreted hydrolase